MRRITAALGTLAAAGALALGVSAPAFAANGPLIISGQVIMDPAGCHTSQNLPQVVENYTDSQALIFSGPNCTGRILQVLAPQEQSSELATALGLSVFVA